MIVVTGAAGFIGSAVVHSLNERGVFDILAVDTMDSLEQSANLASLRVQAYLRHDQFLAGVLAGTVGEGVSAVIHLGACSSTLVTDSKYLAENNTEYTRQLAEYCMRHGARFIYASSAATYGDGANGYSDDHAQLTNLQPLNEYARSKHEFDLWAAREGALDRIVGLKYFNVFGPNEGHKGEMRSMICKGYEQVRSRGRIRLFKSDHPDYADGEQVRDFIYVKDAVRITLHFLHESDACGIFNVGSGVRNSWNTVAESIFASLNMEPMIEYIEMPNSLKGRYQYDTLAEIGKLRGIGYGEPNTPIGEAIRDYVVNYLVPGRRLGYDTASR